MAAEREPAAAGSTYTFQCNEPPPAPSTHLSALLVAVDVVKRSWEGEREAAVPRATETERAKRAAHASATVAEEQEESQKEGGERRSFLRTSVPAQGSNGQKVTADRVLAYRHKRLKGRGGKVHVLLLWGLVAARSGFFSPAIAVEEEEGKAGASQPVRVRE